MQALNLVPVDCLESWARRRRVTIWTSVCLVAVVATIVAAGHCWSTGRSLARLEKHVAETLARQSDLDRALERAAADHDALLARAEAVASLRRPHALPGQLAELSNHAPEGVVFERIDFNSQTSRTNPRPSVVAADGGRPAGGAITTEMTGYAVSHQELDRLIKVIHTIPQWRQVRLLRAASEPYLTGQAIAFHLVCLPEEQEQ
jgi:hypothetical protein